MPSKKKRSKLAKLIKQKNYNHNKGIYKINKIKINTPIYDIICDSCKKDISCECYNEQHLLNNNRICSYRSKDAHEFPISKYTMKGNNCDVYLVHICSKVCNEKFKLLFNEYKTELLYKTNKNKDKNKNKNKNKNKDKNKDKDKDIYNIIKNI